MKVIAIDIGTSRIKVACFDETGVMSSLLDQRLDRAASPNTQDARIWFEATAGLLRRLTGEGVAADAVVLTGNMHALLGIAADGEPVAPAVLWSDNASIAESDELNRRYRSGLLERFGNSSTPVFTLPKLLKMKSDARELYRRSSKFLQSKDYIAYRLTGNMVTDCSDASGTLLMELENRRWSDTLLTDLKLDGDKLPTILPSASVCGQVTAEAAGLTGLAIGTPVVIGAGDLATAALGSGVNDETLSLTLGTAGQLLGDGAPGCGRKLAGKLFVFAHANPERELYLGSVPSGGFSFEWLARLHHLTVPEFLAKAAECRLEDDLPFFLPYILGRGAPYMDYVPNGAWLGLKASHQLPQLCRAAIFGTLGALRQCTDLLEELAGPRRRLVMQALACREEAVKATAGALFRQHKLLPENSEASLLGAAMIGMAALKVYPSVGQAVRSMGRYRETDLVHTARAEELYRTYRQLAERL